MLPIVSFIELTCDLGPEKGYADGAYFDTDIWPIFLSNLDAVEKVFLFINSGWGSSKKNFESGEKVSPNIADIGPMEWLSNKQLREIEGRSFFGGHLNVLYLIAAKNSVLTKLLSMYPQPVKLNSRPVDTLPLKNRETVELGMLVSNIPDSHVLVGFAHDADPLYIFGSLSTLESLLILASSC